MISLICLLVKSLSNCLQMILTCGNQNIDFSYFYGHLLSEIKFD